MVSVDTRYRRFQLKLASFGPSRRRRIGRHLKLAGITTTKTISVSWRRFAKNCDLIPAGDGPSGWSRVLCRATPDELMDVLLGLHRCVHNGSDRQEACIEWRWMYASIFTAFRYDIIGWKRHLHNARFREYLAYDIPLLQIDRGSRPAVSSFFSPIWVITMLRLDPDDDNHFWQEYSPLSWTFSLIGCLEQEGKSTDESNRTTAHIPWTDHQPAFRHWFHRSFTPSFTPIDDQLYTGPSVHAWWSFSDPYGGGSSLSAGGDVTRIATALRFTPIGLLLWSILRISIRDMKRLKLIYHQVYDSYTSYSAILKWLTDAVVTLLATMPLYDALRVERVVSDGTRLVESWTVSMVLLSFLHVARRLRPDLISLVDTSAARAFRRLIVSEAASTQRIATLFEEWGKPARTSLQTAIQAAADLPPVLTDLVVEFCLGPHSLETVGTIVPPMEPNDPISI